MKHLPQSLGVLGIEGRMDSVWPGGAPSQRRLQTALVELVDGVAGGLWVATQRAGDPVGILAPVAGEQDLLKRRRTKASDERRPSSRDLRSASESERTKIGRLIP
jgi:hypothetical protein